MSKDTPITGYMAEKNEKEVDGMKRAHLRDAVAIIEFLAWFEKEVSQDSQLQQFQVDCFRAYDDAELSTVFCKIY